MNSKITIIDDLHPEDNAMLQALQSRSPASVEERLNKVQQAGSGQFMDKFYVGYGHRSIGDCGNTTIFIEGVTMLMAKAIQDWPLYSGQEASTRYMDFSEAEFANPLGTLEGEQIQEAWRDFYLGAQEPIRAHLRDKYPRQEGEDEATWERAINARSFDILRSFLPAGATTNLSWSTNLRQAQDHLNWLFHHPDRGVRSLAESIHRTLSLSYPHSFKDRVTEKSDRFARIAEYEKEVMNNRYFLSEFDEDGADCLGELTGISEESFDHLDDVMWMVKNRPRGQELPWFLAELGMLRSSFLLDFGSYRDLQRHRNGVIRMPLLTTKYGFRPWYIYSLPVKIGAQAIELMAAQEHAINQLDCDDVMRQNYIAMGYQVPCRVSQSLPAFVYRLELRSSKSVHPTLREVIHEEIRQFKKRFPSVTLHVDMDPDSWTVRRGKQTIEEKV